MNTTLANTSIKKQLIILLIFVSGFIATAVFVYSLVTIMSHEKERFVTQTTMEGKLVSDFILSPLAFDDKEGVRENLTLLSSHKDVRHIVVYDQSKQLFTQYNPHGLAVPVLDRLSSGFMKRWFFDYGEYNLYMPITYKNSTLGYLYLQKESSEIGKYLMSALGAFVLFAIVLMSVVGVIVVFKSKIILEPILALEKSMQTIAKTKDYTARVSYPGNNEIARLYTGMNAMLQETQNLTEGLEYRVAERTKELQNSLENLTLAQGQLIESEKMAALGNLVSGVAHEVNTPLGNALTGGSIILREASQIQHSLEDGSLKRSAMDEKLSIIIQSATLMIKSLSNAAELVKNFKRISVDQSTDDLRDFDVRLYLEEIIQTYHNKLKSNNVTVEIHSPALLLLYSYPGAYAQIFSNLLNNTLLHAFEGVESSKIITITLEAREKSVALSFKDNGVGVDEKIRSTIFEPFVTTKRNAGGTGLGMNIVYNLVTRKLGGTIHLNSEVGKGTGFEIVLPYLQKKTIIREDLHAVV